jgi:hypothetical protein
VPPRRLTSSPRHVPDRPQLAAINRDPLPNVFTAAGPEAGVNNFRCSGNDDTVGILSDVGSPSGEGKPVFVLEHGPSHRFSTLNEVPGELNAL